MGWGFAIIVDNADKDKALDALEKTGAQPEQIGTVTSKAATAVRYKNKKIILA
jgi:phosphoribosylaminoimidazole (AIR) synthetase